MHPATQKFVNYLEVEASKDEELAKEIELMARKYNQISAFAPCVKSLRTRAKSDRDLIQQMCGDPSFK